MKELSKLKQFTIHNTTRNWEWGQRYGPQLGDVRTWRVREYSGRFTLVSGRDEIGMDLATAERVHDALGQAIQAATGREPADQALTGYAPGALDWQVLPIIPDVDFPGEVDGGNPGHHIVGCNTEAPSDESQVADLLIPWAVHADGTDATQGLARWVRDRLAESS